MYLVSPTIIGNTVVVAKGNETCYTQEFVKAYTNVLLCVGVRHF
jgi:hypothetical protein